ncbi:hypothetical protein [Bacillus sp. JJ1562]|uniref:hypothetical protein n=1 Tax=Bacillus sp. JJ1562 TaxID=3122960 RepID=UPI00300334D7
MGSSAIPNSITRGDLDIQVRVDAVHFQKAVQELSSFYGLNVGSTSSIVLFDLNLNIIKDTILHCFQRSYQAIK